MCPWKRLQEHHKPVNWIWDNFSWLQNKPSSILFFLTFHVLFNPVLPHCVSCSLNLSGSFLWPVYKAGFGNDTKKKKNSAPMHSQHARFDFYFFKVFFTPFDLFLCLWGWVGVDVQISWWELQLVSQLGDVIRPKTPTHFHDLCHGQCLS